MVRVLIVDDSAFMRRTLTGLLSKSQDIEVVGAAINGEDALVKCKELDPDVVTMDIEMPKMDGLTALKHLMRENPLPVLMISSLTHEGASVTLEAMEEGALGYVTKVSSTSLPDMEGFAAELIETVKAIARRKSIMRLRFRNKMLTEQRSAGSAGTTGSPGTPGLAGTAGSAGAMGARRPGMTGATGTTGIGGARAGIGSSTAGSLSSSRPLSSTPRPESSPSSATSRLGTSSAARPSTLSSLSRSTAGASGSSGATGAKSAATGLTIAPRKGYDLLIIGVSTGGPPAVQKILLELPAKLPVPILVAQHMPASFTGPFAKRLDSLVPLTVKEADPEEKLMPGTVYVCPGGKHFRVENRKGLITAVVTEEPKEALYKPSVNVLFETAGEVLGKRVLGVMLTGMGYDGLEGSKVLKAKGGTLLAQSEASCVVYGMPKAVVDAGLTDGIIDIDDMASTLLRFF